MINNSSTGRKKLVVLSGAGISAESGLKTFRDADGLWEGHRVEDVATPEAWYKNPAMVNEFYNQRRAQLKQVLPNEAHHNLVKLETKYQVTIITQNVDDLHERAGSSQIIHLHGELLKVRSTTNPALVYTWEKELKDTDLCEEGSRLRPHIVWFGESVPMLDAAVQFCVMADYCVIIGTSMQVYPAASLVRYVPRSSVIYYIDPAPNISPELRNSLNLKIIKEKASLGTRFLLDHLA